MEKNIDLGIVVKQNAYSDVDFALRPNPVTNDIAIKRDVTAIKQSVINILSTNKGERPFLPDFGSNIQKYLFEQLDDITITLLKQEIVYSITNYEPRVRILQIEVIGSPDSNAIHISLEVEILTAQNTITDIEFIVERLR